MFISAFREYYLKILTEKRSDIGSRLVRNALYPLSLIYGFIVKTRIFFYKEGIFHSIYLSVPVISVGNITMGGTGKTPVVEFIARYLQKKGKRVAILSRGYAARIQQDASPGKNTCNDEFLIFKENIPDIPNLLNRNRVVSGLEAIQRLGAECLLLDDGFQHLRLGRDIDIVIIDTLNPFGYEQIIPGGMLREPLRELRRADMIVLTHVDQSSDEKIKYIYERLNEVARGAPTIETIHKPICLESIRSADICDISHIRGKRVFAFCAIGNPLSFRKSIEGLGAELIGFRIFPDHHVYTASELAMLNKEVQDMKPDAIITTQKDKVKMRDALAIWDVPFLALKTEICIVKGYEVFENKINTILN